MRWLRKGADAVGVALFSVLFLVFLVQIVARFFFDRPLPWTDEAAVMLYVWVILWAAAVVVPEREHVMFDLVWSAAGPRARRAMRLAGHAMIGGLAAWALPATWDYVRFMAREGTPVLGVPFMVVFLPFALLLVSLVVRGGLGIWRAFRGLDLEDAGIPRE
ncbi:MAG TPA: TRAP transporter small permease [Albitalea sp.]|uniref:TRAP transporter small permease n=1 Tax=Piscinibacter sp. TaxID=1903157 RepID=UPI002ED55963